jgi:hypothetical protein
MTNVKSLMLAAVTALTLTAGAAMAQEGGSFSPAGTDFWAARNLGAGQAPVANAVQSGHGVQSGSSDTTLDPGMRAYEQYNPYLGN